MNKQQEHLKHVIFNDACSMDRMGINHNASDRSCCYDIFLDHIASPIFTCHYNVAKERYERELSKTKERYEREFSADPNNELWSVIWSPREIEEYATKYAMKRLPEAT